MNKRGLIYRLTLVVALAAGISWLAFHREFLQASALVRELGHFGWLAPILFVGLYALSTVLFVPGSALTLAGGALFGPIWGTLWNLTGATVGAALAFLTARYVAHDWVTKRAGERLGRLVRGVEEEGWRFVAFVRLVPIYPFNLVNYAFGLTQIRFGGYVLASLVCMTPGAVAYTYLGYAGREAAAGSASAIRSAIIGLGLLAAIAFLPRLVRRLKGQRYIDAVSLKRRLESGEAAALLDVRTAEEFIGPPGHIAGAINIPVAEISERLSELAEMKGPIITI